MADKNDAGVAETAAPPPAKKAGKSVLLSKTQLAQFRRERNRKKRAAAKIKRKLPKKIPSQLAKRLAEKGDVEKKKKPHRGGMVNRGRKARKERKAKILADIAAQKRPKDSPEGPPAKRPRRKVRDIATGEMRFCRPVKFHRRGKWKCVPRRSTKTVKKVVKKPLYIKKEIGGDKNGGFRMVLTKKRRQNYPTADPIPKRRSRGLFKDHKRYTRRSLKVGTILILLTGPHRGKRVVLMKVLKTGLLLINGPFSINGCPLRRVNQNYVIATRTRIKMPDLKVPDHINDKYFKRLKVKKSKKEEGDIFTAKKEKYVPSEQRKADQKAMDKVILDAMKKNIKKWKDRDMLDYYLRSKFGLKKRQRPHSMKF